MDNPCFAYRCNGHTRATNTCLPVRYLPASRSNTRFIVIGSLRPTPALFPHNNTRHRLHPICIQTGLNPPTEPANLLRNQDKGSLSQRRPDLSVGGLEPQGRILILDVTTTDLGCATSPNTRHSETNRGGAAAAAECRKQLKIVSSPIIHSALWVSSLTPSRWRVDFYGQWARLVQLVNGPACIVVSCYFFVRNNLA